MHGASVTMVLIGDKMYAKRWVDWEFEESAHGGNDLLGIKLRGKGELELQPC